ncbi:Modification methylase DpnIIA [Sphingomonas sp. S2M10]|uniref:DNA adenine methylase n=1 Tax=Sphingomonas sp. S2M10 TaxID=2705010 RepID=UPI0014579644|nr:DNA adenine methylase [Sphingomonas sp. S2M10]NLS28142.1 Modification methylase DpnIIA [Sphingomonas sp. S2M10]
MTATAAVEPAAGYLGGKRRLATRLIERIEAVPHRLYAEPFVGMGGVFLRRRSAARAEAINDISGDVANFFRVLQRHPEALLDLMRWRLSSRVEFERLRRQDPSSLTDLERADRFLFLQRLSYGGKVKARTFGTDAGSPARYNPGRLEPKLRAIHRRLSSVTIEQLPYAEFIRRYDRPDTLFYLDPPYWGCEGDYGAGVFDREDFARLAEQLAGIQGKFLLSINDTPGAREVFGRFVLEDVETTWSVGARVGAQSKVGELIIRNYA